MQMKRVKIFTLCDNSNYGNRLQNYAVQEILSRLGCSVSTLYYIKKFYVKQTIKNIFRCIAPQYKKEQHINRARAKNFASFDKNIKKTAARAILNDYIKKKVTKDVLSEKIDFVVEGSDQVWNPYYTRNDIIRILNSKPGKKLIAFSASIAIDKIPVDYYALYKEHFCHVGFISVREEAGEKLIKKMTGRRDVEVLLDPTMLIDRSAWDSVMKKPKVTGGEKYILCYFLGKISNQRKIIIEKFARESGAKIIYLMDNNDPYYTCGPAEFLYLESHAELVCTDSFHSSVFAIIYSRPFLVFNREDSDAKMNSRLETLLNKFHLNSHWYQGQETISDAKITNQKGIEAILRREKKKSEDFLKLALGGNYEQ